MDTSKRVLEDCLFREAIALFAKIPTSAINSPGCSEVGEIII
ncbi:MAG TPA: hypothetical protein V6D43_05605 [Candidatus Sericytochromatia bacterium]